MVSALAPDAIYTICFLCAIFLYRLFICYGIFDDADDTGHDPFWMIALCRVIVFMLLMYIRRVYIDTR
jgi:hypothetical protein